VTNRKKYIKFMVVAPLVTKTEEIMRKRSTLMVVGCIALMATGISAQSGNTSFTQASVAKSDTVLVSPAGPITSDSLSLTVWNADRCCGTVYRDKAVSVNDTMILLSYSYDDSLCPYILCLVAGSSTLFKSKPLAAGTYAIYKQERVYCPPGRICTQIITTRRIGRVTVTGTTGIRRKRDFDAPQKGYCLVITGTTVSITLSRNAHVSLRLFTVKGERIGQAYNGLMHAGTHRVGLNAMGPPAAARETLLLKLMVDGTTETRMIVR
jgi:hypothetical protein